MGNMGENIRGELRGIMHPVFRLSPINTGPTMESTRLQVRGIKYE